jgi:Tat protein secretion system quality control protein TatD with DNase activity
MTKKYYNRGMKTKIFKKQLTIKTKFNPSNIEDVKAFENACDILKKQGVEFEKGIETTATEFGKKLYFRYSLITDLIIWVIMPLIGLIIFI